MLSQVDKTLSLGRCLKEYRSISSPVIISILLGLLALLLAFMIGLMANSGLVAFLVFGLSAISMGWMIWAGYGYKIALHEQGVHLITRRYEDVVFWPDITAVTAICHSQGSIETLRISRIILTLANKSEPLPLKRVSGHMGDLLQALYENTKQTILQHYIPKIEQGEPLVFAKRVRLTQAGIL